MTQRQTNQILNKIAFNKKVVRKITAGEYKMMTIKLQLRIQ
jgi:hypothetical protein